MMNAECDANNASVDLFKFKERIRGQTDNNNSIKDVEIMVPLKFLSNFWSTLEMSLINSEINLFLTWSTNCVIKYSAIDQATRFAITDAKLYILVVTFSNDGNAKPCQQLKSGFKRLTNWNNNLK